MTSSSRFTCLRSPSCETVRRTCSKIGIDMNRLSCMYSSTPSQPAALAKRSARGMHPRAAVRSSMFFIGVPRFARSHGSSSSALMPRVSSSAALSKASRIIRASSVDQKAFFRFSVATSSLAASTQVMRVSKVRGGSNKGSMASGSGVKSRALLCFSSYRMLSTVSCSACSSSSNFSFTSRRAARPCSRYCRITRKNCDKPLHCSMSSFFRSSANVSTEALLPSQRSNWSNE
mmetsp:Transcript_31650/g.67870  ORF Transcript_31650/g.67870 Transcript_31650/m.67870 type:complete len:232 (-) Transcript_31650:2056-2751(-)